MAQEGQAFSESYHIKSKSLRPFQAAQKINWPKQETDQTAREDFVKIIQEKKSDEKKRPLRFY